MSMLMITVSVDLCNPLTQKTYDDVINSLQFHQLTCPCCGHSACLTVHGYYDRSIRDNGESRRLHICRLVCSQCGRTHAVLLSSVVPYSRIPLADQADIVAGNTDAVMERSPLIDESSVRHVLRQFRRHWRQKLISAHISLAPLAELAASCFSSFGRQFMQIKTTPNILYPKPT